MTGYRNLSEVTAEYLCPNDPAEGIRQLNAFTAPFRDSAQRFENSCNTIAILGAAMLFGAGYLYFLEHTLNSLVIALGFILTVLGGLGDRTYDLLQEKLKLNPPPSPPIPEKIAQILNALIKQDLYACISITKGLGAESDSRGEDGQPLYRSLPGGTFRHRYAPLLLQPDTKLYHHALFSMKFFFSGNNRPIYVVPKSATGDLQSLIKRLSDTTATLSENAALNVLITKRTIENTIKLEGALESNDRTAEYLASTHTKLEQNAERGQLILERSEGLNDRLDKTADDLRSTAVGLGHTTSALQGGARVEGDKTHSSKPPKNKTPKRDYRWLVGGTDEEFEAGLDAFIKGELGAEGDPFLENVYRLILREGRKKLQNGVLHGDLQAAVRHILIKLEYMPMSPTQGRKDHKTARSESTVIILLGGHRQGTKGKRDITGYFLRNRQSEQ